MYERTCGNQLTLSIDENDASRKNDSVYQQRLILISHAISNSLISLYDTKQKCPIDLRTADMWCVAQHQLRIPERETSLPRVTFVRVGEFGGSLYCVYSGHICDNPRPVLSLSPCNASITRIINAPPMTLMAPQGQTAAMAAPLRGQIPIYLTII